MLRKLSGPIVSHELSSMGNFGAEAANNLRGWGDQVAVHRDAYLHADELYDDISEKDLPALQTQFPLIYEYFVLVAQQFDDEIPRSAWGSETIDMSSGVELPFLKYALIQFLDGYRGMDWAFHHLDEAQAEIRSILEQRLLKLMDTRIKLRAQDDLDRVFYRTLSELRRQQAWRRSMSEIAINTPPKRGDEAGTCENSEVS